MWPCTVSLTKERFCVATSIPWFNYSTWLHKEVPKSRLYLYSTEVDVLLHAANLCTTSFTRRIAPRHCSVKYTQQQQDSLKEKLNKLLPPFCNECRNLPDIRWKGKTILHVAVVRETHSAIPFWEKLKGQCMCNQVFRVCGIFFSWWKEFGYRGELQDYFNNKFNKFEIWTTDYINYCLGKGDININGFQDSYLSILPFTDLKWTILWLSCRLHVTFM